MELTPSAVRGCRLRAHHLLSPLSPGALETAAGACGLQNSPPGSWELALFNRVADCSLAQLEEALCRRKTLLQAWSYRGAPVVFPTGNSGVFLSPLAALPGEEPWIYTQGLPLALDHLGMTFGELLPLVEQAARYLDHHAVHSKEELDRVLAKEAEPLLPREKLPLWRDGSMYGRPDRQTVGGAVVSFLLRPCSFRGLVVFGEREGGSPWFLSYRAWLNQQPPQPDAEGDRELVRRFLRCYGPATQRELAAWLDDRAVSGAGDVAFVIGSSHGLAPAVKQAAALRLSMGRITLPHQLARLVLTEQIYRACCINRNIKYHK